MTDCRSKHMDTRTSVSSPVMSCGWLELQHSIGFPDDVGQVIPAAGTNYRVTTATGQIIEGQLDEKGSASLGSMGHATVAVEYEPQIDAEIKQIRTDIKTALDEFIAEEQRQNAEIQNRLDNQAWYENTGEYIAAGAKGLWNGLTGLAGFIWDAGKAVANAVYDAHKFAGKYLLDPLNAPETFKQDVAKLKSTYKELERFADEELETYFMLMQDEETWDILETFAKEFLDAQHALELTEGGGEAVFGIILTLVTAGAGGAAAATGAGARITKLAQKLSKPFKDLISKLKRRRARHRTNDGSDRRVETEVEVKSIPVGHTKPTGIKGGKPTGHPAKTRPKMNDENKRSIKRENESADILADAGYKVEQNPTTLGNKEPDLLIEGKVFDVKSPSGSRARNAASEIEDAVLEGQADRIVLNLEDSNITLQAMKDQLDSWPIEGLKEVIVIKDGNTIPFWP